MPLFNLPLIRPAAAAVTALEAPTREVAPPVDAEAPVLSPPTPPSALALSAAEAVAEVIPQEIVVRTPHVDLAAPLFGRPEGWDTARAANTERAFAADWEHFERWCYARHPRGPAAFDATPERAVASYLFALATTPWVDRKGETQPGLKLSTIQRRLTGVVNLYRSRGVPFNRTHPAIAENMAIIRSKLSGGAQGLTRKARPIRPDDLAAFVSVLEWWERPALLLGFWGALRQDEIRNLLFEDITRSEKGLTLRIRTSKAARRKARVEYVGLPVAKTFESTLCPVATFDAYKERSGRSSGFVFVGPDRVGRCGGCWIRAANRPRRAPLGGSGRSRRGVLVALDAARSRDAHLEEGARRRDEADASLYGASGAAVH